MIKVYFDSSVYTKIFADEDGSETAREIIGLTETTSGIQIVMSLWTINEAIAAIDQKAHQRHEITTKQANQTIATILQRSKEYTRRSQSRIVFVPVEYDVIKGSTVLIHSCHISADDALHIFTAFYYNCKYFICKDKAIQTKANKQMSVMQLDTQGKQENMLVLDITNRKEIEQQLLSVINRKSM
jgi:predicted nucleic acid-binding protein